MCDSSDGFKVASSYNWWLTFFLILMEIAAFIIGLSSYTLTVTLLPRPQEQRKVVKDEQQEDDTAKQKTADPPSQR